MITRIFSRKDTDTDAISARMSVLIIQAIEILADRWGENRNTTVVLLLDEILQQKAAEGLVPWPKGYKPSKDK